MRKLHDLYKIEKTKMKVMVLATTYLVVLIISMLVLIMCNLLFWKEDLTIMLAGGFIGTTIAFLILLCIKEFSNNRLSTGE